ncbi:hypothetical protein PO909_008933 [Leuciscus waleckii]
MLRHPPQTAPSASTIASTGPVQGWRGLVSKLADLPLTSARAADIPRFSLVSALSIPQAAMPESRSAETTEPETVHVASAEPETVHVASAEPETVYVASAEPETVHVTSSEPETVHVASADPETVHVTSSEPETVHVASAEPETVHVASAEPETVHVASAEPETVHVASAEPETVHVASADPETVHVTSAKPVSPDRMAAAEPLAVSQFQERRERTCVLVEIGLAKLPWKNELRIGRNDFWDTRRVLAYFLQSMVLAQVCIRCILGIKNTSGFFHASSVLAFLRIGSELRRLMMT